MRSEFFFKIIIMLLFTLCAIAISFSCAARSHGPVINDAARLKEFAGKRVEVEGSISTIIWQHMVQPTKEYPIEQYFDIGNYQIVIYMKKPIPCKGAMRVIGTVVELLGSSKDPRRKETVTEYHINVDSWRCL